MVKPEKIEIVNQRAKKGKVGGGETEKLEKR